MTTIKKPVKSEPKHEAPTPPQRTPAPRPTSSMADMEAYVAEAKALKSKTSCDVCGTQLHKGDQCPVDGKVKE